MPKKFARFKSALWILKKKMLRTKEIEEESEFKYDSLKLFAEKGWIPKPTFRSNGHYGACLMWPVSVLSELDLITALKKCGYSNKRINTVMQGESTE